VIGGAVLVERQFYWDSSFAGFTDRQDRAAALYHRIGHVAGNQVRLAARARQRHAHWYYRPPRRLQHPPSGTKNAVALQFIQHFSHSGHSDI
jgi:hypothetical protein